MADCQRCGAQIPEKRLKNGATKFCSKRCNKAPNPQRPIPSERRALNVSTGTVGAIGELIVSCDLLRRGSEVFRALSPSASCDLAMVRDGRLLRVEVRTGYMSNGVAFCAWSNRDRAKGVDVLALVDHGGSITYLDPATGNTPRTMSAFVFA